MYKHIVGANSNIWIGLTDAVEEGIWLWTDTYPINGDFLNFAAGQSDSGTSQNCALLGGDGLFHDENCEGRFNSVCEMSSHELAKRMN